MFNSMQQKGDLEPRLLGQPYYINFQIPRSETYKNLNNLKTKISIDIYYL